MATKQETQELLNGVRAACLYGLLLGYSSSAHGYGKTLATQFRGAKFGFNKVTKTDTGWLLSEALHGIDLTMFADILEKDPRESKILHANLDAILLQSLVQRTFELVARYCDDARCRPRLNAEPWYQYARIVRNTASHNDGVRLHRWPDNCPDEVEWDGHKLKKTDVGGTVDLPAVRWVELHEQMAAFFRALPE